MSSRASSRHSGNQRRRAFSLNPECLERRELLAISLIPTGSSLTGSEGSATTINLGSFTDSDTSIRSWKVDVDWGDGTTMPTLNLASSGAIGSTTHAYGDNGVYKITQKVTSSSGQVDVKTLSIAISNANPTVTAQAASASATVSDAVVLKATGADVSPADAAAGLVYTWDFGDGGAKVSGLGLSSVSHAFAATGTYRVTVTTTDKDGGVSSAATTNVTAAMLPIPDLALWQSQMLTHGAKVAAGLVDPTAGATADTLLGMTYYDAERVFFQIADYTKDSSWLTAAQNAEYVYRERYVVPNSGGVPGYWNFAKGMAMDYLRTGDPRSYNGVMLLSQNAAYTMDSSPLEWTADSSKSREVAYAIDTLLQAEALGAPHRSRLDALVGQALGHIDQWFISRTAAYYQPFMAGITAEALIGWYEKTGDARVLPAIRTAMDSIWNATWLPDSKSFMYVNVPSPEGNPTPAPDLNMLIAPAFAWLYRMTGDSKYRDRGDLVFQGGVQGAWLDGAKQFNQSYRWSFDYVNWRSQSPLTSPPSPNAITLTVVDGQTATEGSAVSVKLGSFTDSLPNESPWALSIDWGDGGPLSNVALTQAGSIAPLTHVFKDNGVYVVTQKITSSSGATATKTFRVTAANAAPSISFAQGPYSATVSDALSLSATATDPSATDTTAGLTYTWNFGDGSPLVSGVGLTQPTHPYRFKGTYTVTVTATDKDGARSSVVSASVNAVLAPIANLSTWQSQMTSNAQTYVNSISSNSNTVLVGFDVAQVYYQIADYTGASNWSNTAKTAAKQYRDNYVLPNHGGVSASYNYGRGLATDYLKTGNSSDRTALTQLVQYAAYGGTNNPASYSTDASKSEPVAEAILTLLGAAEVGVGNASRLSAMTDQALGHLNQWFVTRTATSFLPDQVGKTLLALIRVAESSGDSRVLPAVKTAIDWMWANAWSATDQGFRGVNRSTTAVQAADPNMNLILAPAFAWYYRQTGDVAYRNMGDQVFTGGVLKAKLGNSINVFTENYIWSIDFVKWRQMSPKV